MKITAIEIRTLSLPMIRPFATSFGTIDKKDTIIIKLYTADGLIGYGESSALPVPFFNGDTAETCMQMTRQFVAPIVAGKELSTIEDLWQALTPFRELRTARSGLECAFWHLLAQRDNRSLKELLGGTKKEIAVGDSIGIQSSLDETMKEIAGRLQEGYQRIKVKIKPGWDREVLATIREAWPNILLTADGNAGYKLAEHATDLQALDQFDLAMLEQPLAMRDFVDHAALQHRIQTPICLDETVQSIEDMHTADTLGSCRIINLKPMRIGGLYECLQMYDYATKHNLGVWCGGTFETGIGRAFNIALASKERFDYPADMSPYPMYFAEDLVEDSFVVKKNGCIDVPDQPGLGYKISDSQIEKFTTEKITIRA